MTEGLRPTRGYSWPPFQEGNKAAATHGAHSPAIVAANAPPVVAELVEAIGALPYLEPIDAVVVEGLARKVVQRRLVWEHIDRLGGSLIDARGRPRGCWKLLSSLDHSIREDCKVLGIGPAVRAQLLQSVAGAGRDVSAVQAAQERLRAKVADAEDGS